MFALLESFSNGASLRLKFAYRVSNKPKTTTMTTTTTMPATMTTMTTTAAMMSIPFWSQDGPSIRPSHNAETRLALNCILNQKSLKDYTNMYL